jgi:transport inhibitor response 1
MRVSQLVDFVIGSFIHYPALDDTYEMLKTILKSKSITSLSGFLDVPHFSLALMYPICWNLTSLNLSSEVGIQGRELIRIIRKCDKLRCLRIMNCIVDKGLGVVITVMTKLDPVTMRPLDEGFGAIMQLCKRLRRLSLSQVS